MAEVVRWVRRGAVAVVGAATVGGAAVVLHLTLPQESRWLLVLTLGALILPAACALAWWLDRRSVTRSRSPA